MDLRNDVETLLGRQEHAGNPLADYLAGCLSAYEPDAWQRAVAIREEWNRRLSGSKPGAV